MRRSPATPHATAISKRPTDKTNTGQPPQFPTPAAKTPTERARRHARESSRPLCHAAPRSPKSSELLVRPAQNYWLVRPVSAPHVTEQTSLSRPRHLLDEHGEDNGSIPFALHTPLTLHTETPSQNAHTSHRTPAQNAHPAAHPVARTSNTGAARMGGALAHKATGNNAVLAR